MVSSELISDLKRLDRSDKFYIVQLLIAELAEQEIPTINPGQSYPVWSPYGAEGAAKTMLDLLQSEESQGDE